MPLTRDPYEIPEDENAPDAGQGIEGKDESNPHEREETR